MKKVNYLIEACTTKGDNGILKEKEWTNWNQHNYSIVRNKETKCMMEKAKVRYRKCPKTTTTLQIHAALLRTLEKTSVLIA